MAENDKAFHDELVKKISEIANAYTDNKATQGGDGINQSKGYFDSDKNRGYKPSSFEESETEEDAKIKKGNASSGVDFDSIINDYVKCTYGINYNDSANSPVSIIKAIEANTKFYNKLLETLDKVK